MSRPRKSGAARLPAHLYERKGKRGSSYFTRTADNGYVGLGRNLEEAKRRLEELLNDAPTAGTIADMAKQYIVEQRQLMRSGDKQALSRRTVHDYEEALVKFVLPVFGHLTPDQFEPTHAAQYLRQCRLTGRPIRGNRDIAALGSTFNWGMSVGLARYNPCRGVRRNKETPRTRAVSIAEANGLLQFARTIGPSAHMVALIAMCVAVTGRRRAEVIGLTRAAVTSDGLKVRDAKTKPGEPERIYLVEMSPLLSDLLKEAAAIPRGSKPHPISSVYLFPARDGGPYRDQAFKCIWNRIQQGWAKRGNERFTAHDLRSLFVTVKRSRGENPETHRNRATEQRVYDRNRIVRVKPIA